MYIPKHFQVNDPSWQARHMADHPFATVVTTDEDGLPFVSHLPLKYQPEGNILRGHMARANPQWLHFESGDEILCVFTGAHAYISPSWHVNQPATPTWNYSAVHVYGRPSLLDEGETQSLVYELASLFDTGDPHAYAFSEKQEAALIAAIVGFEIEIVRVEGKAKLSQNRRREDQDGMIAALDDTGGDENRTVAAS